MKYAHIFWFSLNAMGGASTSRYCYNLMNVDGPLRYLGMFSETMKMINWYLRGKYMIYMESAPHIPSYSS